MTVEVPIIEDQAAITGGVANITRCQAKSVDQMLSFLHKKTRCIEIREQPFVHIHVE